MATRPSRLFALLPCVVSVARGATLTHPQEALNSLRMARMAILAEAKGCRVAPSPGKGFGVFATRRISEFENLGDYTGELLTQRDIDARYGDQGRRSPELWTPADQAWAHERERRGVGQTGFYLFQVDDDVYLDGEDPLFACWTRYLNQ